MKRHTIYDSQWAVDEHEGDNWDDFYDFHFDDEVRNLFKELENRILFIADLDLWNGHRSGYSISSRKNLNAIMYLGGNYDGMEVCVEGNDVVIYLHHHDGCNRVTARLIKDEDKIENLTDKIYDGDYTRGDVTRYTKSLAKMVKEIYGWK